VQGNVGASGATGPQGPTGPTGSQGVQGAQGPIGNTGAQGTQGVQGVQGNTGATGPGSICGNAGSNYIPVYTSASSLCNSVIYQSGSSIGINTTSPVTSLVVSGTDGIVFPSGNTGQRPTGVPAGTMRWNTTYSSMEVFDGSKWLNINTPPIGSTFIQWYQADNPNNIYPNTVWTRADLQAGEFLRATGGGANVSAGASLNGVTQFDGFEDHSHALSGSVSDPGTTTGTESNGHTHNWGGWWSNDDSRDYNNDNGDGNGNTISDNFFWWGGSQGTTTNYTNIMSASDGSHSHTGTTNGANPYAANIWIPYDDNLSSDAKNLSMGDFPTTCGSAWGGLHTVGNFMGQMGDGCMNHNHTFTTSAEGVHAHLLPMYAHRHWLKQRATSDISANHTHSVPAHALSSSLSVGSASGGNVASETRPVNQAAAFWRRVN
jgi:hypothetical protein